MGTDGQTNKQTNGRTDDEQIFIYSIFRDKLSLPQGSSDNLNSYDIMNSYIQWCWCFFHWLESPHQAVSHHFMLTTQNGFIIGPFTGPSEKLTGLDNGLHQEVSYLGKRENRCHIPHGLTLQCHRTVHVHWLRKLILYMSQSHAHIIKPDWSTVW